MAIQSTGSITPRLAQLAQIGLFQRSVANFMTAQATLDSTDGLQQGQALSRAFLKSRLTTLNTLSATDQVQQVQFAVAQDALEQVETQLLNLQTLIGGIVGSGTALEQAQVDSIVSSIQSTLQQTLVDNPNLIAPSSVPASQANLKVESVVITKVTDLIPTAGTTFSLDLSTSGSQSSITTALDTAAGTFTNNTSFVITGPDGTTGTINITGGVTTVNSIVNTINSFTASTGVYAVAAGGNTEVNLFSEAFGPKAISILDTSGSDPANEVSSQNASNGTNAAGTLTSGGVTINVVGDGRSISFSLNGVEGIIQLLEDPTALPTGNPAAGTFTVTNGGVPLLGEDGGTVGRITLPAFLFGTLGRSEGGLGSVDVQNNLTQASNIVSQALTDLSDSLTVADFLANNFLPDRVDDTSTRIDTVTAAQASVDNLFDAQQLYTRIEAEARLNGALAIISQFSGLYPASTLSLL